MTKSKSTETPKRTRHARGTAAESKLELLQAAIKLLKSGGVEAVTTSAVTRMAGFTQSAFYQHFSDVNECLEEVARQISKKIRTFVDENRRQAHEPAVDWETLNSHFKTMIDLFRQERVFCELFLRHRRDTTPLGKIMRKLHRELCQDLTDHLQKATLALGANVSQQRLELQAELILAQVFAAGESVLDKRHSPELLAKELSLVVTAAVHALAASSAGEPLPTLSAVHVHSTR